MDPLIVRWDRTVIHPDPNEPGDQTIVCCLTDDGQPVALLLDDRQRDDLRRQLVDDSQTLAPHRPGRRRRSVLIRRSAAGHR